MCEGRRVENKSFACFSVKFRMQNRSFKFYFEPVLKSYLNLRLGFRIHHFHSNFRFRIHIRIKSRKEATIQEPRSESELGDKSLVKGFHNGKQRCI